MSIIYKSNDIIGAGRYQILKLIGEGGAGVVYQCQDKSLLKDRPIEDVAIKILRQELIEDEKQVEIFKHEAQLATLLQHPNIVAIYDIGTENWQNKQIYYLVMEYLPGGNLTKQIRAGISAAQAVNWMKQLLGAIGYAHRQEIIHQDIKSANVYLTDYGQIKIGDFGLARIIQNAHLDRGNALSSHPKTGTAPQKMGTPAYMSPELCYGEIQDERSDIYSLGVLFFEMLTGQMPFEAQGMIELARQHISKPVPSISRIRPTVPSALDNIVKRMMAKDKDERFQSAQQVLTALESVAI